VDLLIDENLSPLLALWANERGVPAQAVGHVGLQGASDEEVWRYAYQNDQVVVTINVGDFMRLAKSVDLHPGVIAIREAGLTRQEQWERLQQALAYIEREIGGDLINQVIEVRGISEFKLHRIPTA
jgi:predicted nuclease of predicted toxin-antitoxin system